jgi:YVTN family beta-propeller protein
MNIGYKYLIPSGIGSMHALFIGAQFLCVLIIAIAMLALFRRNKKPEKSAGGTPDTMTDLSSQAYPGQPGVRNTLPQLINAATSAQSPYQAGWGQAPQLSTDGIQAQGCASWPTMLRDTQYAPPANWGPQPPYGQDALLQPPPSKRRGKRRLVVVLSLISILVVATGGLGAFIYRTIKHSHPALTALSTVQDISLGHGPPTRFDYQSLDPQHNLLLISRSGANSVLLFNIQTRQVVAEIPGIADGHGLYAVDALGRIYVSAGGSDQVVVIDEHSYKIIARINVGKGGGPDGMAYDPVEQKLFVSDETGNNEAVINVKTDTLLTEIPLGGNVGNTQYDAATDTIYVNVETHNQLAAINPKTNQVVGHYPLAGCNTNHGMQIDSPNRLMFIACTGNATLIALNMKTMQVTDHATIGTNPDVLALDEGRHILYVASESGVVSIFAEQGSTVHKLAEGYIAPHAHTVGVDQQTHLVYLPLENLNGHPVIRIAQFNPPPGS